MTSWTLSDFATRAPGPRGSRFPPPPTMPGSAGGRSGVPAAPGPVTAAATAAVTPTPAPHRTAARAGPGPGRGGHRGCAAAAPPGPRLPGSPCAVTASGPLTPSLHHSSLAGEGEPPPRAPVPGGGLRPQPGAARCPPGQAAGPLRARPHVTAVSHPRGGRGGEGRGGVSLRTRGRSPLAAALSQWEAAIWDANVRGRRRRRPAGGRPMEAGPERARANGRRAGAGRGAAGV